MHNKIIIIRRATFRDLHYSNDICHEMDESAKIRKTGIAKRSAQLIGDKIKEGNAVIAVTDQGQWVGFIFMAVWESGHYVSHCGLIVAPAYRRLGVGTALKEKIFTLARKKYPQAKIFGISTALATFRINARLGMTPVTFNEVTKDPDFWQKCKSCLHYKVLEGTGFKNCFCTAMLFDPTKGTHNKIDKRLGQYSLNS